MLDDTLKQKFMEDITLLKFVGMNPIVVHGGGPDINKTLDSLGIEPHFENGLRVTDGETMDVVQMVLTGKINKNLTAGINSVGGKAVGICGIDGNVIRAQKKDVYKRQGPTISPGDFSGHWQFPYGRLFNKRPPESFAEG